ncbi:MAG TPA: BofC C-terminal domain-containing protein [Limnochordales bacterium]
MTRKARWWLMLAASVSFAAGFLAAQATLDPVPAQPNDAVEVADEPPCSPGEGGFVGLHEGKVAVFAGTPDGCHKLVEKKPIGAEELPSFQVRELEAGIPFDDGTELFHILEGLMGP